jgi:hypothetical protein
MKQHTSFIAMLRVTALALLVPAAVAFAAQTPDSASISKLFQQARDHAEQANDDISVLDSSRFSNYAPQMHGLYLQKVKEHAAELFRDYYQLQVLREKGTPQQREAIDRLEPLLKDMATSLTNTLQTFNAHPSHVQMPPYRNRIHSDWQTINAVYEHLCQCTDRNSKI